MKRRIWYKRKRFALLIFVIFLFLGGRMEWTKLRYNRKSFLDLIDPHGTLSADCGTREVNGQRSHFISTSARDNRTTLIMVHGSPGALNAFKAYICDPELNTRFNLIAVDRSGFGYSDFGRAEPSLAVQAALIATILEDLPTQRKILVGHSFGGAVIARLAMDYPELVDGLIMVAPSISPELEPSNGWRKVLNFPLLRWMTPSALRVCNQEIIPLKEQLTAMMPGWKTIIAPVTVIQGELDNLVPMENADFAREMMDQNPSVKTVIVKGGTHFILWNETALIKREILMMADQLYSASL